MTKKWARAALAHPAFCGISHAHLGILIEGLADPWLARCESERRERRGVERQREAGAGPKHDLVFTDRLLVTLVYLRTGLPHAALAELFGVARSTISRAIGEIRPLLAVCGFAVPDHSGVRLRTLADVFAYAEAAGTRLRIDGAETQVRRPKASGPGRRAFISGKATPEGRVHEPPNRGGGRAVLPGGIGPQAGQVRGEETGAALVADLVHAGREQGPLARAHQETRLRLGQDVLDDADGRGVREPVHAELLQRLRPVAEVQVPGHRQALGQRAPGTLGVHAGGWRPRVGGLRHRCRRGGSGCGYASRRRCAPRVAGAAHARGQPAPGRRRYSTGSNGGRAGAGRQRAPGWPGRARVLWRRPRW
ncbi:transposase family protein [Streptomyces sp. NPDC012794]|uniref:helix-turn-helix domain-containing protein n=1 Tax=Streptomyces sp. NPDC012794 TaxID=3364850 RepID=UPI0036BF835D